MSALKHLCDADRHFAFRIVMGFDSPHGGRNRSTEPSARMACAVDAAAWLTGKIMTSDDEMRRFEERIGIREFSWTPT